MFRDRRLTFRAMLLVLLLGTNATRLKGAWYAEESSDENIVVTGRAVCLDQASQETSCENCKDRCGYGVKTAEGKIFALDGRDTVKALFTEEHVKGRELRLTLRKKQTVGVYELVKSQFIRDGHLYNFYYFCDICNITTHAPGPCMCCGKPVEYREELVR